MLSSMGVIDHKDGGEWTYLRADPTFVLDDEKLIPPAMYSLDMSDLQVLAVWLDST